MRRLTGFLKFSTAKFQTGSKIFTWHCGDAGGLGGLGKSGPGFCFHPRLTTP